MRLFVALALPDVVAEGLSMLQAGVPGAHWQTREQLHLTLRFIGEVDGRDATAADDALSLIEAPRFSLALKGVGEFGGKTPHALWAGVRDKEQVTFLQRKIETALQRAGLPPEQRKYLPHVTLARLKGSPCGRVMDFLTDHALYASQPFDVEAFILYSSVLTPNGSIYRAEKAYRLK
ncbi:MAG TPA: RNA 2',3'-cyclic phosphodiesterase [Rhizomicrobium sp.]|nr:RNA 2',3'-cyclic phosphodiesterase [Rhizomicrobium sp.]